MTTTAESLATVTDCYVHGNCSDGLVCALQLQDAMPRARIHFLVYGTPEHRGIKPHAGALFADMSPWMPDGAEARAERIAAWRDAGAIILDHHKTARDVVEGMGGRGVFGDEATQPGICGATLVYNIVTPHSRREVAGGTWLRRIVRLAGIRDTWQRSSDEWCQAVEQHAWLSGLPRQWLMDTGLEGIRDQHIDEAGAFLLDEHQERVQRAADSALLHVTAKGTRVRIVPDPGGTISDVAELIDTAADLIVGFQYRAQNGGLALNLSLRSHTTFDCAAFAKAHGGGGHTKAAGCTLSTAEWDANPLKKIACLLADYEESK